jgi:GTPase
MVSFFQIKRSQIRKGMVMVSPAVNPSACWEFEGEILVLHHPTTISSRYQAMGKLNCLLIIIHYSKSQNPC